MIDVIVNPGEPLVNPYTGEQKIGPDGNPILATERWHNRIPTIRRFQVQNGISDFAYQPIVSDGQPGQRNDVCVMLVRAGDLAPFKALPGVLSVFEDDEPDRARLNDTLREREFNVGKLNRVKNAVSSKLGIDLSDVTLDTPVSELIWRAKQLLSPRPAHKPPKSKEEQLRNINEKMI